MIGRPAGAAPVLAQVERDGIAMLPGFLSGEPLTGIQRAFQHALRRLTLNTTRGSRKPKFTGTWSRTC